MGLPSDSQIRAFYKGKNILVTGASGFMGKVLVEKILYSCPDVGNIFMLVRPKRGKSVSVRISEMWKLPLFSRLRKERPSALDQIKAVQGDVTIEKLGLSDETLEMLQNEVNIVFHLAATLKLEAKLKDAIEMNTTGTWRVLEACRPIKNLDIFVHLSTAFCYADHHKLAERVDDWSVSPQDLMRITEWMDEKSINQITPNLLDIHPNTYTYSKRLAETMVRDEYPNMRICIARPSIVSPAWEEPVEGWVDNLNGPVGLMIGAGKGVIRSMHCNGEYHAEVIPVDYAISALIVLAYRNGVTKKMPAEIPVYNLTTSDAKNTSWAEVLEMGRSTVREYPFDNPLWYPDGNIRKSKFIHNMCVLFFHLVPAYFIDFMMLLFRQKRFMVRIQNRISDGLEVLQFFTTREWYFNTENFRDLANGLSKAESEMFPMNMASIDEREYIKRCILGGRQYCLKEPLSSLPRARVVNRIMYFVDRFVAILFYGFIFWQILKYFTEPRELMSSFREMLSSH